MKLIKLLPNKQWIIFYIGLLLLFILITGCLSESSTVKQNATVMATPTLTPTPVVQTPQTPRQITSDEIKTHFMDIAFGVDTFRIIKRIPKEISTGTATDSDKEFIQNFIFEFNDLSNSGKIFENIKDGTTGDLKIIMIPQEGMKDLSSDFKTFKSNNIITAKIDSGKIIMIYINNNLKGDQRNHTLLKSLYYAFGVKGDTLAYPDSLFYYDDNNNTKLTLLDKKAIQILFGLGIVDGMRVADIRQIIYLK